MDVIQKLRILGARAKFDTCATTFSNRKVNLKNQERIGTPMGACNTFLPDGRCISVLKVLQDNRCIHDCAYCVNSVQSNDKIKTGFTSEELCKLFMSYYLRNYVSGLFLSSGVCRNSELTMERMIETIKLLRLKYNFDGYIHLKILPGAPYEIIKEAASFADRISVNCEGPNETRFHELTSTKNFKTDILRRMAWIKGLKNKFKKNDLSQSTQYVVGGANETDLEIIKMSNWLYDNLEVNRAYYSAFIPVKGTKLEKQPKISILREHRLYQTDWLKRIYKFDFNKEIKLAFDENGFLSQHIEPKTLIALNSDNKFPIEINNLSYQELLRIPGIGPKSARRIIHFNKKEKITRRFQLMRMGAVLKRADPFIKINGKSQKKLFDYFIGMN
ncbi:MAG: putative DNA modification/repair radical SAM protein [Candidatus Lokiarchaeota archaeon]|nr:putative DNA modification/repair radical SAM protein [Candidatus Lokiarchaeota archaeon]